MNRQQTMNRQQSYDITGKEYADERYGAPHMRNYAQTRSDALLHLIEEHFAPSTPLRVLEVGCGPGLSLEYLANKLESIELFGVDFSTTMLNVAGDRLSRCANLPNLVNANAFELPFHTDSFDAIYATRFIHQFPHAEKKRLYAEFSRVTRHHGLILVEFYKRFYHRLRYHVTRQQKSSDSYFSHYPTSGEVQDIVGARYRVQPVRLAGDRLIHSCFGHRLSQRFITAVHRLRLSFLFDEYFVVSQNVKH